MFADDTNLVFSSTNLNLLYKIINDELSLISNWFKVNNISFNIKKTDYILFCSGSKKIDNKGLDILIDKTKINQVTKTKFLSGIITDNLNLNEHIKIISCKLSKNIGILFKIHHNIDREMLLMLYHTLILTYLEYCNIVWSNGCAINLQQLFQKQKKGCQSYYILSAPIFNRLKLLKLSEINVLQNCCFVSNLFMVYFLQQFKDMFVLNNEMYSCNTRNKNNIHITSNHINVRARSIKVYGTRIWNSLNQHLKDCLSFEFFKRHCKNYTLSTRLNVLT